jgi:hypothetical protein
MNRDLAITGLVALPVFTFAITQGRALGVCAGSAIGAAGTVTVGGDTACSAAEKLSISLTLAAVVVSIAGGIALHRSSQTFQPRAVRRKLRR